MKYRNKPRVRVSPYAIAGAKLLFWIVVVVGVIGGIAYAGKTYPEHTATAVMYAICLLGVSPLIYGGLTVLKWIYLDMVDAEKKKRNFA